LEVIKIDLQLADQVRLGSGKYEAKSQFKILMDLERRCRIQRNIATRIGRIFRSIGGGVVRKACAGPASKAASLVSLMHLWYQPITSGSLSINVEEVG